MRPTFAKQHTPNMDKVDAYAFARDKLCEDPTFEIDVLGELGKGANNVVLHVRMKDDRELAFRVPRTKSDTQQRGSAKWEAIFSILASQMGVAPKLHSVWFKRHRERKWKSGLYMLSDLYPYEMEYMMTSQRWRDAWLANKDDVGKQLLAHLKTLSDKHILAYDVKPSNVVLKENGSGGFDARIIDFGTDFVERRNGSDELDRSSPVVDFVARLAGEDDALVSHLLFATMLLILSATITVRLRSERYRQNLSLDTRKQLHPLAETTADFLASMQGKHRKMLREVLRHDEIRGVLRHYHSRRNAGTERTFKYAKGQELP